jgi:esterase
MHPIHDGTILLDAGSFYYREAGDPAAAPVILLHALGRDAQDWDAVAQALAGRFHVFALDQRGHGQSVRPDTYSFESMRDDLHQFASELGFDVFTLIGHSMGGTVALLFAERWPERLKQLVIEDTPPPYHQDPPVPLPPENPPAPVAFDWRLVRPIYEQLRDPDPAWWSSLPAITVPTLLIAGGSASHIPQEKLAEVARLIPTCQLITIEAGHSVHQNKPAEYLDAVLHFLED